MRNYSAEEVMQYVSEMEVKFIRLAFCDIFGRQKNIAILPSEPPKAFSTGIAFDASAIAGFGGAVRSPTCSSIRIPPPWWRSPGGRRSAAWCGCSAR